MRDSDSREQRLRVRLADADVAFERLDLGRTRLDDPVDGHAEGLERRFDDLLLDRGIGAGREAPRANRASS